MEFQKPKKIKIGAARTTTELAIDIGVNVRAARLKKGWKQSDLAKAMQTTQPAIARLEKGKAIPSLDFILRAARALDTGVIAPTFETLHTQKLTPQIGMEVASKNLFCKVPSMERNILVISNTPSNIYAK